MAYRHGGDLWRYRGDDLGYWRHDSYRFRHCGNYDGWDWDRYRHRHCNFHPYRWDCYRYWRR
ncbi:hypothetical protein ABT173_28960 [Streptomyces sp. NPDC001795]|uniref:hypothetical protein n=1 Tax=unclassified Streptomyces TaxID=2593676 RepID=UPI003320387E